MSKSLNTRSPHFWWIICILTVFIILQTSFILTERVGNANKIMEFISYSSAILSITLSIFAILYTYISNVQIQQQFDKINSVADSIKNAAKSLAKVSGKLDDNLESILNELSSLNKKQQDITEQLNKTNSLYSDTEIVNNIRK